MTKPAAIVQKALTAIQFFEETGRTVVGVSIEGTKYKLEFADEKTTASGADLVTMGK